MAKKLAAFRIEPEVQNKLRILSAERGMPIGEIIDGLTRFAEQIQQGKCFYPAMPSQLRVVFGALIESCFYNAMSEARAAAKQAKIEKLTSEETAEILARHEENEKKVREAYKAAGLPYPDEEEGLILPTGKE